MTNATLDAAIVGGGVAGTALLMELAARAPAGFQLGIFEPNDLGPGTAYRPQSASLLLNGPVRAMSLACGDESHLERWLVDERSDALICRARYGSYARASAAAALASRADFSHVRERAEDLRTNADGTYTVATASGATYVARAVVLALGNFAPADHFLPPGIREFAGYYGDPWRVDVAEFEARDAALLGSRLTAMDVVALLDERAFRGRVHLISRHGLLSCVEDPRVRGEDPALLGLDTSSPYALLASMRKATAAYHGDWRAVVDSIRKITPAIWTSWSDRERRRFLRHAQSMWAVHRYRVPAATHAAFTRLQNEGRIVNHRGRITGARVTENEALLTIAAPSGAAEVRAAYVVNCTGPNSDIRTVRQPLVRKALDRGVLRPDDLHLGIDVDPEFHVMSANNTPHAQLYAIGPLVRGRWYETTAVPEITKHATMITRALLTKDPMMVAG